MQRWPGWVYGTGEEPDYRFSLANERTFLAWLRSALALLASGVAVDTIPLDLPAPLKVGLAATLVVLALLATVASWLRWARSERAMRRREPLPASNLGLVMAVAVGVAALTILLIGL